MIRVNFDPDNPPPEPPAAADPLVWRMAHEIRAAHQPDQTQCCVTCRDSVGWPCKPARIAARGYLLALRLDATASVRWPINNRVADPLGVHIERDITAVAVDDDTDR
ncbi:hypothetical protein [Luedemannella helvata]|uniref:hypothetical protein n=1 Tax=Luedemannella helvata TaxID=349315 RepID=UPI0031D2BCD6